MVIFQGTYQSGRYPMHPFFSWMTTFSLLIPFHIIINSLITPLIIFQLNINSELPTLFYLRWPYMTYRHEKTAENVMPLQVQGMASLFLADSLKS